MANSGKSTVIPALRYRDAPAAIEWLCQAFGFKKHAMYPNPEGSIAHAQLTLGAGMVMLGSLSNDSPTSKFLMQPQKIGEKETQTPYLMVADCDQVYGMAKAAGAQMVIDIRNMDYGGRAFTCRDPEGHIWSVGSYDPWAEAGTA